MPDPSYNAKFHVNQGGSVAEVESGATIQVDNGGVFDASAANAADIKLPAGAITAAALGANLKTGYIPLPLHAARLISANDIAALAATGGILAKDSAPILERVNGATDKALRVKWAATSVVEVTLGSFEYPPDLDNTQPLVVNLMARMGGATDTPTIAVGYFEGIGGTNVGGNTQAMSNVVGAKTVSIAAPAAPPQFASVSLTPAAHGTDALELYSAWITYTRKS